MQKKSQIETAEDGVTVDLHRADILIATEKDWLVIWDHDDRKICTLPTDFPPEHTDAVVEAYRLGVRRGDVWGRNRLRAQLGGLLLDPENEP